MKRALMVLILAGMLAGCHGSPQENSSIVIPAIPVELRLLEAPPISPRYDLMPLPASREERRYLAYDLNADGSPEYFVEDYSGAHRTGFALVDSAGKLLIAADDVKELGGDRLIILSSRRHGYHDLLCSDSDPGGVRGSRWRFNGRRYVRDGQFENEGEKRGDSYIERAPGAVMACWYADVFSKPRK